LYTTNGYCTLYSMYCTVFAGDVGASPPPPTLQLPIVLWRASAGRSTHSAWWMGGEGGADPATIPVTKPVALNRGNTRSFNKNAILYQIRSFYLAENLLTYSLFNLVLFIKIKIDLVTSFCFKLFLFIRLNFLKSCFSTFLPFF